MFNNFLFNVKPVKFGYQWIILDKIANTAPIDNT